jgi:predicted dehydrogenase
MSKKYRGALIGCGLISPFHARAYQTIERVELAAVADKNYRHARQLAQRFKVNNVYRDYEQMLKEQTLDFVEVLTPHSSHFKIAQLAIDFGLNINLQKPPTVNLKKFVNLKREVQDKQVKLRIFENFRFYEPYQYARNLIDNNQIGQVKVVNIKKWGAMKNALQGGLQRVKAYAWRRKNKENHQHPTLFDDGYHKHSLIEYFLKDKIDSVRAWCGYDNVLPGLKVDSPAHVEYLTDSNKLGIFQSVNSSIRIENHFYPCDETIEITGSKGIILIFGGHGQLFSKEHRSPIKQGVYWFENRTNQWHFSDEMNLDIRDSFVRGLKEFVAFLDDDKSEEELVFNMDDAENSLKMGLGIVKSLKNENRLIKISSGSGYDL